MPDTLAEQLVAIRDDLVKFAGAVMTDDDGEPIHPAAHHLLMAWALTSDWLGNTVEIAPPGHAKTYWTDFFCAHKVGQKPNTHIDYISNAAPHALKQSNAIRITIAENPAYRVLFPEVLPNLAMGWNRQAWSVKRASTNDPNPTFVAVGIQGSILGARCDYLIFDDVNTQKQQESPSQRENVLNWCTNTAMSRLKPGGRAINIQTRWSGQDLASWCIVSGWTYLHFRAMAQDDAEEQWAELIIHRDAVADRAEAELTALGWTVEREPTLIPKEDAEPIPAHLLKVLLHTNGPALWPEHIPAEGLIETRDTVPPSTWATTYLGLPNPESGNIIPVQDLLHYKLAERPDRNGLRQVIQVWDTAFSKKTRADYSVCQTWGLDRNGDFWLLDQLRKRLTMPELKKAATDQYKRWQPDAIYVEDAASGQSLLQEMRGGEERDKAERAGVGRLPFIGVKPSEVGIDKVARVFAVQAWFQYAHVPVDAPWWADVLSEWGLFPNAAHDDTVDPAAIAILKLKLLVDAPPIDPEMGLDGASYFGSYDFGRIL